MYIATRYYTRTRISAARTRANIHTLAYYCRQNLVRQHLHTRNIYIYKFAHGERRARGASDSGVADDSASHTCTHSTSPCIYVCICTATPILHAATSSSCLSRSLGSTDRISIFAGLYAGAAWRACNIYTYTYT